MKELMIGFHSYFWVELDRQEDFQITFLINFLFPLDLSLFTIGAIDEVSLYKLVGAYQKFIAAF